MGVHWLLQRDDCYQRNRGGAGAEGWYSRVAGVHDHAFVHEVLRIQWVFRCWIGIRPVCVFFSASFLSCSLFLPDPGLGRLTSSNRECFCSQHLSPYSKALDSTQCNLTCSGNSQQMCGGVLKLSVYKREAGARSSASPLVSSGVVAVLVVIGLFF